jgi:hypothetical protein
MYLQLEPFDEQRLKHRPQLGQRHHTTAGGVDVESISCNPFGSTGYFRRPEATTARRPLVGESDENLKGDASKASVPPGT